MGRGIIYGLITRALFIIGAYVIHVYAGRTLQPELYGTLGVILAILTITSIFYSNGVREAIAKNISSFPRSAERIFSMGLRVQLVIGIPIALAVFFLAGGIASFFQDENLVVPLQICSAVIVFQCLYYVSLGTLNGQKKFLAESVVGITYSVARPIAVVVLIGVGYAVTGATWGFLIASALAAVVGYLSLGVAGKDSPTLSMRRMFTPAFSNILVFGAITVLLNIDLLFVKYLIPSPEDAGLYTAASAFSKPPYWLVFSFGAVALPMVASRFIQGDMVQCRVYLSQVIRYSTILVLPLTVIIAATAEELVVLFYAEEYAGAYQSLSILVFGVWLIGLVSIMAHIMIGIGKESIMAAMAVSSIVLDAGLNLLLIPGFGLLGAALATSLSAVVLLLVCGGYVVKKIGLDFSLLSLFRLTGLSIVLFFSPRIPGLAEIPLLVQYVVLYAGFAIALIIVREIGPNDWVIAKRLIQPRKTDKTKT